MNPRDPQFWMWSEACTILERADQLRRQFFLLGSPQRGVPSWEPPVDVLETVEALTIIVALPGVLPDQVEILHEGDRLRVVGRRTISAQGRAQIRRLEIPYGRFERLIQLPAGRLKLGCHELAHGCLTMVFEKFV